MKVNLTFCFFQFNSRQMSLPAINHNASIAIASHRILDCVRHAEHAVLKIAKGIGWMLNVQHSIAMQRLFAWTR